MSNLILLANEFPYGNWEPYLETELKYYGTFDRVYFCALQLRKEHKKTQREIPLKNARVCAVEKAPNWVYLLYSVTALADKNLYREIKKLVKEKRFSWKRFVKLMVFISRSHYEANYLAEYFKKEGLIDKTQDPQGLQKSLGGGGISTPTVSSISRMWGSSLQSICKATGLSPGHIDLICMKKKGMFPTYQ